jgi:hypothetical protein
MCSEPGRFCRARPDVGLMVIGDDGRRLGFGGCPGVAEERLGGGQVPPVTKQYVDLSRLPRPGQFVFQVCRNPCTVSSIGAPGAGRA